MPDWTAGYVTELDYTFGYYRTLAPALLKLAALNQHVAVRSGRPFRYLELGYGQGLSLNIHAAGCPGDYWGTDFNPEQAVNAREMADASGSGVKLFDQSFAEFAAREDLPEFDVIALHGIWSWISRENRAVIVDLARRRLALGGILFISYNCMPGWSPVVPLRHLLTLHASLAGSPEQGMVARVDAALGFAQQVVDADARYFRANPAVAERLKTIRGMDRNYLAHEFFNRDWEPMPFAGVVEMLADAKVDFAASASLLDHYDHISFAGEGMKLMAGITHPVLRQSVRDYLIATQFRQDVFVKGGRKLTSVERLERYLEQSFVLLSAPGEVSPKFQTPIGEATVKPELHTPLIEALADSDFAPKTLAQLQARPALRDRPLVELIEAVAILVGANHVHPAQDAATIALAAPRCAALNAYLCDRARVSASVSHLASPVTGSGVMVGRFQQLFLLARLRGRLRPQEWADFAWQLLSTYGQRLIKDGKELATAEENLAELTRQATEFAEKRLPLLRGLGVA